MRVLRASCRPAAGLARVRLARLGASVSLAALQAELDQQRQTVLDLTRTLEERDEELAAARETNRRLMTELNRISGAGPTAEGRDSPG